MKPKAKQSLQEIQISEGKNDELLALNKEFDAFTYSVSHDLRAPLRAVKGFTQILKEDYATKLDDKGKRIIETIHNNAVRMETLLDELLSYSRLGRKELVKVKIDMNKLTNDVLNELHISNLNVKINDFSLHSIQADKDLIHQVMFSLISNAIKYSSKKEWPFIEISSLEEDKEIIFSVKDNGAGFDMKYYDKLFGVFQRLHSKDEFEGIGISLAVVQRIIRKHGGRVWAEGQVGLGATFYFSLPINY